MLSARVRITATDEGRETLLATLAAEVDQVPSMFKGFELFVVSVDAADRNTIMITEEWSTKEQFDLYVGSDHFAETMKVAAPCLAAPPNSAYYLGERVGP